VLAADTTNVEKITVYGQKISRTLQETKESIAVVSEKVIDDLGLLDVQDAYHATANVFTLSNGENFGIRGITQNAQSTGGGNGELGSYYMDGVAYTGFATRFGPRDLWDVKQIEILRGPQSTNVGRQALIGAVVVKTNAPDMSGFDAAVRARAGNFNTRGLEGMLNLAAGENAALRVTAETYKSDGYIDNTTLNIDGNPTEANVVRAKYLYEPNARTDIKLTLQYADKSMGWDTLRYDLNAIDAYVDSANIASFENYEGLAGSLDIGYQINDAWHVRSISSGITGEYERLNDDDGGPDGGNAFRGREVEDDNYSQEVRFSYDSGALRGVIGLYHTEVKVMNNTSGLVNINPALLGVPGVLLPFYADNYEINTLIPSDVKTTNSAIFTEWDYKLNDQVILSAGVRYDQEKQTVLTNANNTLANGVSLPDPTQSGQMAALMGMNEAVVAQVVGGITQVNAMLQAQLTPTNNDAQDTDFTAFLPQLGVTYQANEDVAYSLFYKRGYRSGGVDVDTVGSIDEYDAETLDNIEFSLRSLHFDGDLVINMNAYYGRWKDQQLTVFVNGSMFDTDTINAGKSSIYGIESELQYTVSDDTIVYLNLGLAHTEFDEFCYVDGTPESDIIGETCQGGDGVGQDLSGNDFAASPTFTGSAGIKHYFTDNLFASLNVTHQDASFNDVQNTQSLKNDAFTLTNLSIGYQHDDLELRAYARNIFDEFYTNFRGTGIGGDNALLVMPGVPREIGVTASYRF
jgi:outer membrane receptor protein involved in Fe transport